VVDLPARLAALPATILQDGLVVVHASTPLARLRGLAGLDALPDHVGLHLPRTRAVHTFGMRLALDLVWLARDGAVVRVDRAVRPRAHRGAWRAARSVVEVRAGRADAFLRAGLSSWRP
jgi:uncharacterized membrane protein (UPF0127 family)